MQWICCEKRLPKMPIKRCLDMQDNAVHIRKCRSSKTWIKPVMNDLLDIGIIIGYSNGHVAWRSRIHVAVPTMPGMSYDDYDARCMEHIAYNNTIDLGCGLTCHNLQLLNSKSLTIIYVCGSNWTWFNISLFWLKFEPTANVCTN